MAVTEIARITLREPLNLDDTTSETTQAVQACLKVLQAVPGLYDLHHGIAKEDEKLLVFFFTTESKDVNMKFVESDAFKEVFGHLSKITDFPPDARHIVFGSEESVKRALAAPVVELLSLYTLDQDEQYAQNVDKFATNALPDSIAGFHGQAKGWADAEVQHESFTEGNKGRVIEALIGWESIDAHKAYAETQLFKDNVSLLAGAKARELKHIVMRQTSV